MAVWVALKSQDGERPECYMVVPGRRKTGTIEILGRNACVEDPILRKLTALRQAVDLDAPPLAQV